MLNTPLPAVNDIEGCNIPDSMPFVIDSHVHIFPDGIFESIWKWFDAYAWPVRYKYTASEVLGFLLSRGVGHVVALQYAHKPGLADELNLYMAKQCHEYPHQVTGLATVFPGEEGSENILKRAFEAGLKGVKLHAHVQCFDMSSEAMDIIYHTCASAGKPIVMHVGREPNSKAYRCDPYVLCRADKLERVIQNYPALKVCVPHLGTNEYARYQRLIEKYDNLWLDTAMVLTNYLPNSAPPPINEWRVDRIMYGSDFPNIPYAWDRELKWLYKANLSEKSLERIMAKNAINFYAI